MKLPAAPFTVLNTVADFTQHYGFAAPTHPLVAIIDLAQHPLADFPGKPALRQLYVIVLKRHFHGQLSYGQQQYDYRPGVLGFYAPGQPVRFCPKADAPVSAQPQGWLVVFHPDLLARRPLGQFPGSYPFFAYRVQQALALSDSEEQLLTHAVTGLRQERAYGADEVFDYTQPGWSAHVLDATQGQGVDIYLDSQGEPGGEGAVRSAKGRPS